MRQVIWTNFAISELKNIYLYYRMVANDKVADKMRKSLFDATALLIEQPLIGAVEENIAILKQGHRYLVVGNYKIIYRIIQHDIYILRTFSIVDKILKKRRSVIDAQSVTQAPNH